MLCAPALAEEPWPFTVQVTGGAMVTMGSPDTAVSPEAFVETDGPVPLAPRARAGVRLGITSEPGRSVDLADVSTFRAAEVALTGGYVLGRQDVGMQTIALSILGEWGFSTRLTTGDVKPLERYSQHWGVGMRLNERSSGASLTVIYGRDEAAGDWGWGQVMLYGSVPVTGKDSIVALTGDATLSMGHDGTQHDVLRLGVVIDIGAAIKRATHP